jgi:hypothetical protein
MNLFGILGIGLAASLAINALQFFWISSLRKDIAVQQARTVMAQDTAKACSAAFDDLRAAAARQAKQSAAAIEQANRQALDANRRADRERNRLQAVPGDSCASAEVETREWLQIRRLGK